MAAEARLLQVLHAVAVGQNLQRDFEHRHLVDVEIGLGDSALEAAAALL